MQFSVRDQLVLTRKPGQAHSVLVLPGSGSAYRERPNLQFNGRVQKAVEILKSDSTLPVIVSGFHNGAEYAETREYALALENEGIAANRILFDSAAFDTFQTILNLKSQSTGQNYIFVSQKEHLARTVWMARQAGLSASGIIASGWKGGTPQWRITRERLAAVKARMNLYYFRITGKRLFN